MKTHCVFKKRIAVLFGGPSAEHEISILSGLQAISAMDSHVFDIRPFYWHKNGKFYTSENLLKKEFYKKFSFDLVEEVHLTPDPAIRGFCSLHTNKLYPVDVYFLCFHGQGGEDGSIQGLLEMKNAAYTGCSSSSSRLAMNKHLTKLIVKDSGIPVLPHAYVTKQQAQGSWKNVLQKITHTPGLEAFPYFVKPCHLGSSIGITATYDLATLQNALAKAFYYDDAVLVEPCITELMELNVAVFDTDPVQASIIEMPVASNKMLSFEDKYMRGGSKESDSQRSTSQQGMAREMAGGMAGLARFIDPEIDPEMKQKITDYAKQAFASLGCSGIVRFDFIVDLKSGTIYCNELNPIPGSLSYYLWEKTPPFETFTALCNRLIDSALKKQSMRLSLQTDLEFRVL